MDVTPLIRRDARVIQSYADGIFKISGQTYDHSIFVMEDRVLPCALDAALDAKHFSPLADLGLDVVLVGLPVRPNAPHTALRAAIRAQYGFSVDIMDIGAACRTYNVLMAEGRRVAVALIKA
jgi:uncharacterized protein